MSAKGMSKLEIGLLEENKRLNEENKYYKALLQECTVHLISVEGDEWFCIVCGERAPMETETEKFPHKGDCALHQRNKV